MRRLVGRRQDFSREREDHFQRPALGGGDHDGAVQTRPVEGEPTPFEPVGVVDEQGIYTVTTKGKDGAPPGWYKVLVTAAGDYQEHPKAKNRHPGPRSLLPARYGQEKTSDLAVEVVEHPAANAYDLKLSP